VNGKYDKLDFSLVLQTSIQPILFDPAGVHQAPYPFDLYDHLISIF
jgi:hypothetical protein